MIHIAKPYLGEEEKLAVNAVIDSGMIATGAVVNEFEKAFAAYIGSDFGVATTSGTTALEVGLRALGIGAGDKVLTTPFSFIASTNAIVYVGATPVFADIDVMTFCITPESIEQKLKEQPDIKAILIVHLFGLPCDMDRITAIAKKHNVFLIEDCAQCHGALYKGKNAGTFGDFSAFSFYPTKNMTTGEGGIVLTSSEELAKKMRLIINHGMEVRYYHDIIGYNYRMTNIASAIGLCQLKKLDGFNQARIDNAALLDKGIKNKLIKLPYKPIDCKHVYHQYTIQVEDGLRDLFVNHLEANGIGHGIFYPLSIPEQRCYEYMNFNAECPVTDMIKKKVVSLPVHPQLSKQDVQTVIDAVNRFEG